jgi:hypothetical protein
MSRPGEELLLHSELSVGSAGCSAPFVITLLHGCGHGMVLCSFAGADSRRPALLHPVCRIQAWHMLVPAFVVDDSSF